MRVESRFAGCFNASGLDGGVCACACVCVVGVEITMILLHRKDTCKQDTLVPT